MLFDDTYKTVSGPAEGIFKDRGSRFLGFIFPVADEDEVKEKIAALKKEHFGARHHCYAFRLGPARQHFRSNDDGEPSGTAGKPILGQIQSHDLTNVLIVVVRYFGGTLLGVSGLIAAYRGAAADAIAHADIIEKQVKEIYRLSFPYAAMNEVMKILKDNELGQWGQDFQLSCTLHFSVRRSNADAVLEKLKRIDDIKCEWEKTE
ncbi:MAG TPA: YigZ family protein [Bacteroidia bacterium]|nr:YigZ family protein [Bacteroidia bacterium]